MTSNTDRLPFPDTLTDDQQRAVDAVVAGPRGKLLDVFVPFLRAPELMTRLQRIGEYIRYESSLPGSLRELAILMVARQWDQDYEWGHHVVVARRDGLDQSVIDAVAADVAPESGSAEVLAVWRLVDELVATHRLSDSTYAAAEEALGDTGVVELVTLIGYYTTLAMTMNAANTPVPADYERLPARRTP